MKYISLCILILLCASTLVANTFSRGPIRVMTEAEFQAFDGRQTEDSVYVCDLVNYTGVGLTSGGTFELAFRATPTELGPYAGQDVIAIIWYHYDGSGTGQVKVYDNGTATSPGAEITTEPYTPMTGWTRVDLTTTVPITGTGDLWFSVEVTHGAGFFPGGCDAGPHVDGKGDWIYFNGSWAELYTYGLDYNWQIIAIVGGGGAGNLITWDFEDGWQDWVHTNGQAWPDGWAVMEEGVHGNWAPPNPGDSCFWVDDNAAGNGVTIQDTILSPRIEPDTNTNWLSYGLGYNWRRANEWVESGIYYFDGASWTAVQLMQYTDDFGPDWDSVDVSAYKTYQEMRVYFYYDDGGNTDRCWYCAVDNVGINGTLVGIAEEKPSTGPSVIGFAPDIPNPAHGNVAISFTLPHNGHATLKVYDSSGRLLSVLADGQYTGGTSTVHWQPTGVASGVYFLDLEFEDYHASHKLILMR
jgi:hypothetical protein